VINLYGIDFCLVFSLKRAMYDNLNLIPWGILSKSNKFAHNWNPPEVSGLIGPIKLTRTPCM
jgi:hypothetical protein